MAKVILLIMFAKRSCKVKNHVNALVHEHVVVGNQPFLILASPRQMGFVTAKCEGLDHMTSVRL